MEYRLKQTLNIEVTLNSSEMVMMNQGGKHTLSLKKEDDILEMDFPNFNDFDVVSISFQLARNSQGRFDFINDTAQAHRKTWDEELKDGETEKKTS